MNELSERSEIVMWVRRADGSWSSRPIWVVVTGGDAYVRAAFGARSAWHREVRGGAQVAVQVDGAILPARLEAVSDPELVERVSACYRAKYALSWPGPVEAIVISEIAATTMRLRVETASQIEIPELPA
ncbi:DUF2255 family protein [Nonomuraea turkmeniaca]|uniref:DUF2255 family protein n=1 Tax=Nonomuraea turkmeniaca TaxID=103838 RepID=UPI0014776692|nr:DUF2255 family protein [Nonomuraea turkmeniaca]